MVNLGVDGFQSTMGFQWWWLFKGPDTLNHSGSRA
jgi:hypothetical protein